MTEKAKRTVVAFACLGILVFIIFVLWANLSEEAWKNREKARKRGELAFEQLAHPPVPGNASSNGNHGTH